jgi:transposase-like protein
MRGRIPSGPEAVDQLEGSAKAKERLRLILETLAGRMRVQEACQRLDISAQRFRQLRQALLEGALASLEDRPAGRPRQPAEPEETAALRQQVAELQCELRAAQVREEIALALPQVNTAPPDRAAGPAAAPKKKRRKLR